MGLFPDIDVKGLLATLDEFKALQTELIEAIRENTKVQADVLAEMRRKTQVTIRPR